MNLRDEYLGAAGGVVEIAAVNAAADLMRGDKERFQAGYSRRNAAIASSGVLFPEVTVDYIEQALAMRAVDNGAWEEA